MKNRNVLLFVVLSTILLGGHSIFMARYRKPIPVNNTAQISIVNNNNLSSTSIKNNTSNSVVARELNTSLSYTSLKNDFIEVVWNKDSGAIMQTTWKDGTIFFPQLKTSTSESVESFPGVGTVTNVKFNGNPIITKSTDGQEVVFQNQQGDKLVYKLQNDSPTVYIDWHSSARSTLNLISRPKTGDAAKNLGRVFAITHNKLKKETWASILNKPFFSFLGVKPNKFPSATRWVGMDVGVGNRAHNYFAIIWEAHKDIQCNNDVGYLLTAEPNETIHARLYLGPKQTDSLALFDTPDNVGMFQQVIDFGSFGLVTKLLFIILNSIFHIVHNWGLAIILLAVLVRVVFWPLNTKVIVHMLRTKEVEPFQKKIQAKYAKFGNDVAKKVEMNKELGAFYKRNNFHPLGGCLPSLIQMPIFFAFWSMISNLFALRNAKFVWWLVDLSASDPYFVMPILMIVSTVIQQLITPKTGDPTQRKMMTVVMPVIMLIFLINSPSGLCLYYLIFNIIAILQTWLVRKNYKPQPVVA